MLIDRMPDVLTWNDDAPSTWAAVHDAYAQQLASALAATLGRLGRNWPEAARGLQRQVRDLHEASLARLLLAPETSSRLLWPANYSDAEVLRFLATAIAAEHALEAGSTSDETVLWTALGDARISRQGVQRQLAPHRFPVLDMLSPQACALDLDGEALRLEAPRRPLPAPARARVRRRLAVVSDGLAALGETWPLFVRTFTKVLVAQPDPAAPSGFSSGTSGQFVGRAVIANAHLPAVTVEDIADAVIHESIHGLLYMQEQQKAWVATAELYGGRRVTHSPWTGTALPLRPYMQAAFVWYGLVHFWAHACRLGVFDPARARLRLLIAARGFDRGPLLRQLAPYADRIADDVLRAIAGMQTRVEETLHASLA
jgi:hypothetical protein